MGHRCMLLPLLRRRIYVGGCYAWVAWNEPILSTETFQVYPNLISIWLKEIQSTRYSVCYVWFVIWRKQEARAWHWNMWRALAVSLQRLWHFIVTACEHALSCLQIVLPFVYSEKMFGSISMSSFPSQTTILFCCWPEKGSPFVNVQ